MSGALSNVKMLAVIGLAFLVCVMLMGTAVRTRWNSIVAAVVSVDYLRP